jgi:hypothetical protein
MDLHTVVVPRIDGRILLRSRIIQALAWALGMKARVQDMKTVMMDPSTEWRTGLTAADGYDHPAAAVRLKFTEDDGLVMNEGGDRWTFRQRPR